jgi:EAL domain-containing protein (putative c-di-GMP-specific phosphodiesterase class I)
VLRHADAALFAAKRRGRGGHALFDPSMAAQVAERLELENDLRRAIARDELRVLYQPIVDLPSGRVVAVEALARWAHPRRGLIPPVQFIPLAEETGLIGVIGEWVLRRACLDAVTWSGGLDDGQGVSGLPAVSVNLSPRQFHRGAVIADVALTLDESGLAADRLHLEVTESTAMEDVEGSIMTLRALRHLGVGLAIDDFGTGHSGLSYLSRLPVDTLKIDRSFVSGLDRDATDAGVVRSVIALAETLGLGTIAEGIESERQLSLLRRLGCAQGQGFLFAHPMPNDALVTMLARRAPLLPVSDTAIETRINGSGAAAGSVSG